MSTDIAIDLGTSRTRIYIQGKGIITDVPTVVAIDSETDEIIAVGEEAYDMLGKTSGRTTVECPIDGGVISNFYLVEGLLSKLLKKVRTSRVVMPRVVACIPGEITEVEKQALISTISSVGVRRVYLLEEPIAAAIGAGINISDPHGSFVVDIGGGTTNLAVISLGGIVVSKSLKKAGNLMDDEIIRYMRREYSIVIGKRMAENAKIKIGTLYPSRNDETYRIKGRDSMSGLPKWCDIKSSDISAAIRDTSLFIVREIQNILEDTPPELIGDIYTDGITLTGGVALLRGFDSLISEKTGLKVNIAEDPQNSVVLGAGVSLKYMKSLERNSNSSVNPLIPEY